MGGSKGIGRAITEAFAAEGASVAIAARTIEPLLILKSDLAKRGTKSHVGVCDVGSAISVKDFIASAAEALDGLDVLVNCASSISIVDDEEGWMAAFNTDMMGAVRGTNAVLPYLERSDCPAIVNISSVSSRQAKPDRLPYAAMKAALEQYTASSAIRLSPSGIRVNCVVAGSTDFPGSIWDGFRQTNFAFYEAGRKSIPLGGFAKPEDIANAVVFLASNRARWITGQCLVVDGGQITARP